MTDKSKIEWTDATWNPVRGCSIVSKGCVNCYAMKQAHRFSGPGKAYEGLTMLTNAGPVWNGKVTLVPELLDQPLRWREPRRIFVNSMSDLFHDDVPFDFIDKVFAVMAIASQHTFQVLTKRPERMLEYITRITDEIDIQTFPKGPLARATVEVAAQFGYPLPQNAPLHLISPGFPPKNIWLGTSAEDQVSFEIRWDYLSCGVFADWNLFLSSEPLLGYMDISRRFFNPGRHPKLRHGFPKWVIVGGESGCRARPIHPAWVRSLRDQCTAAAVPFFFKQWGEWAPRDQAERFSTPRNSMGGTPFKHHLFEDGTKVFYVGKKNAGRKLDGRTWDEYPR